MGTSPTFFTLDYQYFPDFRKRKSQPLSATNKLNSLNILRVEESKAAFRTRRSFQKALFFIEPDGVHAQSRLFGHLSDLNPAPGHTFPKYTLESTSESSSLSLGDIRMHFHSYSGCGSLRPAPALILLSTAQAQQRSSWCSFALAERGRAGLAALSRSAVTRFSIPPKKYSLGAGSMKPGWTILRSIPG